MIEKTGTGVHGCFTDLGECKRKQQSACQVYACLTKWEIQIKSSEQALECMVSAVRIVQLLGDVSDIGEMCCILGDWDMYVGQVSLEEIFPKIFLLMTPAFNVEAADTKGSWIMHCLQKLN